MRIWEKILCSWTCAAYCQNCEPNSHALRAQTVVLCSDAMRAHSRIFKQMLILSCAPAAFYVIGNKKCRSKPINSFHAGGRLYLSTAFLCDISNTVERAPPCINAFTVILSILLRRRLSRSPANSLTAFAKTVPPTCQLCSQNGQNCLPNAYYTWRSPFYCIGYVT